MPGLELMEDIWPSQDNISEEAACVEFGGSTDIQTDVTIIAHTHSDWVGPQTSSWSDEDVVCEIKYVDGTVKKIKLLCRIDTTNEIEYYKHGGILQYVLRNML